MKDMEMAVDVLKAMIQKHQFRDLGGVSDRPYPRLDKPMNVPGMAEDAAKAVKKMRKILGEEKDE